MRHLWFILLDYLVPQVGNNEIDVILRPHIRFIS
jgi:hypothetical protein